MKKHRIFDFFTGKRKGFCNVITNFPIAKDSLDHIYPWGTAQDNHTSIDFLHEVQDYFLGRKLNFLDIGCSGGQLAVDFYKYGHNSIGIEGSDYSLKNRRANWPKYYKKVLFTCDATKPYKITGIDGQKILFDIITAWEVVEHISEKDLPLFFTNILDHMHERSIFVGGISFVSDFHDGNGKFDKKVELHQSIFPPHIWINEILPKYFCVETYPFKNKVRDYSTSFYVMLKKKI